MRWPAVTPGGVATRTSTSPRPGGREPDLIFDRVRLHGERRCWLVDVAVSGRRIAAVGPAGSLVRSRGPHTEVVTGRGRSILPGLVDPHLHILAAASASLSLDCGPPEVTSIASLQRRLADLSLQRPAGRWVRGVGLDETSLAERRFPTIAELDLAVPDRPVRIQHRSGHGWILNSAGFAALGLDPALTAAEGWSGEVGDAFVAGSLPAVRDLPAAELTGAVADLGLDLLRRGVTAVQDATPSSSQDLARLDRLLRTASAFPAVTTMLAPEPDDGAVGDGPAARATAVKVVLEDRLGAGEGRARLLRGMALARRLRRTLAVHVVDESSLAVLLHVLHEPRPHRPPAYGLRLEHLSIVPPAMLDEVARTGCHVVTQPGFVPAHGARYRVAHSAEQEGWLYPVASLWRRGVRVAASSDIPFGPPLGLSSIATAVTRAVPGGRPLASAEAVTLGTAIAMHTRVAAEVSGHLERGTVLPGRRADLVLLEAAIDELPVDELAAVAVVRTYVDGREVYVND